MNRYKPLKIVELNFDYIGNPLIIKKSPDELKTIGVDIISFDGTSIKNNIKCEEVVVCIKRVDKKVSCFGTNETIVIDSFVEDSKSKFDYREKDDRKQKIHDPFTGDESILIYMEFIDGNNITTEIVYGELINNKCCFCF